MALMKKLTSAIVASSLVLGLVGTAGATTPDKVQAASARMLKLGLVNGVTPGQNPPDLALNANLTRAQLVTILVRAFGQESNAKFLNGAASFPDAANHPWASGYIAMAKRIIAERTGGREVVGMPDGTFNPDGNVTAAEAVAFLMKFVGAPQDSTLAWPDNYIQGAANAGLITAEDKAVLMGVKNEPATRGLAFYLADRTFYGYKLAEGGTTYTTFVDNTKPALTVDATPATTLEEQVIVTGTVANDAVSVHVGTMDNAATVANGKFTATVKLTVGDNKILVHAVDLAGNANEQTVTVTKTVGTAAIIDAADITVGAGETVDVAAAVKDAKGNVIADAAVTGESTVGTYAAGKFTAGEKAGDGTVTLKSGELTKAVKVTVTAGALATVAGDKASTAPGKSITLLGKDKFGNTVSGVTFSENSDNAVVEGNTFIGTESGSYTVKGTKGDVTVEGKIGVFGDAVKLMVTAPKTIVANDKTEVEVKVAAVDKNGNIVADYQEDIVETAGELAKGTNVNTQTQDGVATFKFKAGDALGGSIALLKFESKNKDNKTLKGEAELEVVGQNAAGITLKTDTAFLPVNDKNAGEAVTVKFLDQAGKKMLSGSFDVTVTVTGPAKLDNGRKTDTFNLAYGETFTVLPDGSGDTGNVEISVAAEGLTTGKSTLKAAFAQDGAAISISEGDTVKVDDKADALKSEEYVEFTARVVDKSGVPTKEDRTARVIFTDVQDDFRVFLSKDINTTVGQAADFEAFTGLDTAVDTLSITNGVGTFRVAGNQAQTFKVSLTDPAGALKGSATANVTLEGGNPFAVAFDRGVQLVALKDENTAKVTAQLYDKFGNKAPINGVKLTFNNTGSFDNVTLNGKDKAVDVRTNATGAATVDVALTAAAEFPTITVIGEFDGQPLDTYDAAKVGGTWAANVRLFDEVSVEMASRIPTTVSASIVDYTDTTDSSPLGRLASYKVGEEKMGVLITVKDQFGRPFDNLGDTAAAAAKYFKLTANDADVQKVIDQSAEADFTGADHIQFDDADKANGKYLFTGFKPTVAGTFTLTVDVAAVGDKLQRASSVKVNPAAPSRFQVVESSSFKDAAGTTYRKLFAKSNEETKFTLQLRDLQNNPALATDNDVDGGVGFKFEVLGMDPVGSRRAFADVRDSFGATIPDGEAKGIVIAKGRNTAKFSITTNAENVVIKVTTDLAGAAPDVRYYVVNPTSNFDGITIK